MPLVYRYTFPAMWLSWLIYWLAASRDVKANVRHESWSSRLSHIVPLAIAAYLFSVQNVRIASLGKRLLPLADWPFWVGVLLTAAGLLFTVWARVHLGRNWSGTITIKKGHELVTSGPYSIVRHPIYTGLLLAFLGSAIALGDWRGVLAFALAAGALLRKLQVEEHWMRQQFGAEYHAYSQRVSALVPFVI